MGKKKHPGGRPRIQYDPKLHPIVVKLHFAGGGTVEQLVDILGVSKDTLYRWKKRYPEFCESWRQGQYDPTAKVEGALYKRAIGYEEDSVKIFQYEGMPVIVDYIKKYPPDVNAAIKWLQNHDPTHWKQKQDIHITTDVIDIGLPPEEFPEDES